MKRAFVLLAALAIAAAPAGAPPKKPPVDVSKRVSYLLPLAASNFAAIRGERSGGNNYDYSRYYLSKSASAMCDDCVITDSYANGKKREQWYASSTIYFKGKPTDEQLLNDGFGRLNPQLKNYKVTLGKRWVEWDSANGVYVYIELNNADDDPGYWVSVGHFLQKPAHVVIATALTAAQKAAVTTALSSVIKLSLNDGPNNFTSLRGTAHKGSFKAGEFESYDCSANFPPLDDCSITGLLNYDAAKWIFEFEVPGLGGPEDEARAFVHSVVADAVPSAYSVTTPSGVYPDDYQWDAPGKMELSYKADYENGKTSFKFTVWHFL